jgi:hypothetical protein
LPHRSPLTTKHVPQREKELGLILFARAGDAAKRYIEQMLNDELAISAIANSVAQSNGTAVLDVTTSRAMTFTGEDAWRIRIKVTPESSAAITGKAALNTLTQIQQKLHERGEDRFAIVEYATAKESKGAGP